MFYPVFKSIWLPSRLTRTRILRGVSLPLVSLGNMHNLEIIEHPFVATGGSEVGVEVVAQLLVICRYHWRVSRWLIAHPHCFAFLCALMIKRIGKGLNTVNEVIWEWWLSQRRFPERFISRQETSLPPDPAAAEYGSTPTLRLMSRLAQNSDWRDLSDCRDLRDITFAMAFALLITQNENDGQHYESRDTVEALNG